MSLRFRILGMTGLVLIVLVLGLYSVADYLLSSRSHDLETELQRQDLARVAKAIDRGSAQLTGLVRNWGWWDDMYEFAQHPTQGFIDRNLYPAGVAAADVNLIAVIRADGTVAYSAAPDDPASEKALRPLSNARLQQLVNDPTLEQLRHAAVTVKDPASLIAAGPYLLGKNLYLIAAVPILSSAKAGPQHGLLVMGRLLGKTYLNRLESLTGMKLSVGSLADGSRHGINATTRYAESFPSAHFMTGYLRIDDINGRPVAVLMAQTERWINRQNLAGKRYLLASLIIFLVIGVLVVVWQVDRLVLHRLDGYDRLVNTIRRTNDLRDYRLNTGKLDELGRLGLAINEMLDALAETQRRLLHDARHDALTGLPNRRLFMDSLEQTVTQSQRRNTRLGIMAIDLDGFKEVNDNFGHIVGDQLLREVSQRLLHSVRQSDMVGRLGGDEFLVMLYDVEGLDSTIDIVRKIINYLAQPYHIGNRDIQISASIGVAIYPDHATHVDELLKRADKLMYRAKHAGKNTYRIAADGTYETTSTNATKLATK